MRLATSVSVTLVAASLTAGLDARAEEGESSRAPRFGERGEVVITSSAWIGISSSEYSDSDAKYFSAAFSPGIDYFVTKGVSIGLDVGVGYGYARGYGADGSLVATKTTSFSGGPRVGVNLPFGEHVSFYPRLTGWVEWFHRDASVVSGKSLSVASNPLGAPSTTHAGPGITLFAPLLLHPRPHFFVGAGPGFSHSFARAQSTAIDGGEWTSVSGRVVIGGWWGGQPVPIEIETEADDTSAAALSNGDLASARAPRAPRFGEIGQWVLTGESGVSGSWTTYAGADASSAGVTVAPGFDYFVAPHVSLGLGAYVSYSHSTGLQPSGPRVVTESDSLGLTGRVGVEIPVATSLSLYPRVSFNFGSRSISERAGQDRLEYSTTPITLSLYVPVLVHAASHFFVGFGPSLSQDLSNKVDGGSGDENLATRVGAGLIVGGWL